MASGALLFIAVHMLAASRAMAQMPAPSSALTLCLVDGPPELAQSTKTLVKEGELLNLTEAGNRLQGLSVDMVSAVFHQILGWPVNVRYTTGFSKTLYQTRVGDGCNVTVTSIFKAARRETCDSACTLPPDASKLSGEDFEPYTCCLDFSHTYFSGGWSLMSKQQSGT
ncbi:hypothetical protein TSOC_005372 [Tetrabaena socialis]|uniref:Uncharacterized protein n=1 Tax=Tetrabaena socialis TaxID=47790 RepID=A0A2J8A6G8_9CHLO|nr:hypothetical protein TSOC_005372 [Tetrabaena socialis]|eukprot:PNH08100.1 hypothetical protein TSOC_005372 [Tetrabaena socialis]